MQQPRITAVMPTSGDAHRRRLLRVAVECFRQQTYPNKRLLILNHGTEPILTVAEPLIEEHLVAWPGSLGALRNLAFEYLQPGDYFITADDDDWFHPTRMQVQFDAAKKNRRQASALRAYTTVDLSTGRSFIRRRSAGGCLGTLLCQVREFRYPAIPRHEDSRFARHYRDKKQLVVVENDPLLYVRTYHGGNVSGRSHILRGKQQSPLNATQKKRVFAALEDFARLGAIDKNPLS